MSQTVYTKNLGARIGRFLYPLVLLFSCTQNPFTKDVMISSYSIRGQVELSDGAEPDNVLIWLRDTQISTRTLADGRFELSVPASHSGSGLNGPFALYFYAANYRMDSVQVIFQNGNLLYGQEGLNEDGLLTRTIHLYKFIDISVTLNPPVIYADQADTVVALVTIKTMDEWTMARGYFSKAEFKGDPTFTAGFLSSASVFLPILRPYKIYSYGEFPVDGQGIALLPILLIVNAGELQAGEYAIVPYLFFPQANIPAGLLAQIGTQPREFNLEYRNMPIKIRDNRLTVLKQ